MYTLRIFLCLSNWLKTTVYHVKIKLVLLAHSKITTFSFSHSGKTQVLPLENVQEVFVMKRGVVMCIN